MGDPGSVDGMLMLLGCCLRLLRELEKSFGGLHSHAAVASEAAVSHTFHDSRTKETAEEERN